MERTLPDTAAPARPRERIPRPMVVAVGLLLLAVLLVVAGLRLGGYTPGVAPAAVLAERGLRFEDGPEGAVRVSDADSGLHLADMHGEQGFLRGVLRGLARERRVRGLGPAPRLALSLHADGRLVILDPETGRRIDLASFGPDNAAVFLPWLPDGALASLPPSPSPLRGTPR